MIKFNRLFLMQIHLVLASFIFSVALMFFITGSLLTWGIKGSYDTQVYPIKSTTPLPEDSAALTDLVKNELEKLNIPLPTGRLKIDNEDGLMELDWRGSALNVALQQTSQTEAELIVKKADWFQRFEQLHKANGSVAFKVYAVILAVSLLMLLITGFIMALQLPKYRKLTYLSLTTGIAVFILMVLSS